MMVKFLIMLGKVRRNVNDYFLYEGYDFFDNKFYVSIGMCIVAASFARHNDVTEFLESI